MHILALVSAFKAAFDFQYRALFYSRYGLLVYCISAFWGSAAGVGFETATV
jgi:hypothetical protein